MPLIPAISVSQSALTPSYVSVTDSSTGSDVNITQRRIFFQTTEGAYLVETGTLTDYENWALAATTDSWNVLPSDKAVSLTVQWLDVSNAVLYTLTQVFSFPQNNKNFFYYLIQQQALTPPIIRDANYFSNISKYWMNVIGAIQAIEIGADVAASQHCLDVATNMMDNQQNYF